MSESPGQAGKVGERSHSTSRGRRRKYDLREVINTSRYLVRAGCGGRILPKDFLRLHTVYWWSSRLMGQFLFARCRTWF